MTHQLLRPLVILLLTLGAAGAADAPPSTGVGPAPAGVGSVVTPGVSHPCDGNFHGHNNTVNCTARSWFNPPPRVEWMDERLVAPIRQLGAAAFRFPAGRDVNIYDWQKDHYVHPACITASEPDKAVLGMIETPVICNVQGFLELCAETGMAPYLVANIYHRERPPVTGWLDHLAETFGGELPFRHLELGNELETWISSHGNDQGLDSWADYEARARPIAEYARAHYPDLRVAINAYEPYFLNIAGEEEPGEPEHTRTWTTAAAADTSWYDGVVAHTYINLWPGRFPLHSDESIRWGFASGDTKAARINGYLADYFGDKAIWITEYGLLQDGYKYQWVYTLVNVSFTFQLMANKGNIESMLHHLAINVRAVQPIQMLRTRESGDIHQVKLTHGWGTIYAHIHDVMDDATAVGPAVAEGLPTFRGERYLAAREFPGISGVRVETTGGGADYMLVNRLDQACDLALPAGAWRSTVYHAGKEEPVVVVGVETAEHADGATITLPPYSLLILEAAAE